MNLSAWLQYIESLHPREIELGLERVMKVARVLGLDLAGSQVVAVAGTNGKGSCVSLLEGLLLAQGFRVGAYTSPHLRRFNERVRIAGKEVSDQQLCDAFAVIEAARGGTHLTYFEFGTLAAFLLFQQAGLEVVILEVGLGGRLDAVNIIDSDVAVVTSIDLDHMAWLGETREKIAVEKIGIMRTGRPLVCADRDPPEILMRETEKAAVPLYLIGRDFEIQVRGASHWDWSGKDPRRRQLTLERLKNPVLHRDLAAAALQVLKLLGLSLRENTLRETIGAISLAGRFDTRIDDKRSNRVLFDVAHNPAAARLLARRLLDLKASQYPGGRMILILAMMADKDVAGFAQGLASAIDIWYIAQVDQDRCMPASDLAVRIAESVDSAYPVAYASPLEAYLAACSEAGPEDTIVVTGSFYIVADVLGFLGN
jgi:dihydrofolate synthase/folylpolyglutamate synthase